MFLQIKGLELILKRLDINVLKNVLFVNENLINLTNEYADGLIVDIIMLNPANTKNVLGGNVIQFLSNLNLIDLDKVTFRILSPKTIALIQKNL